MCHRWHSYSLFDFFFVDDNFHFLILGHKLQLSPRGSFFSSLHPPDHMIWYMNWQLFLFQWLVFRKDAVIVKDSNDTPYFYIVKSVRMTVDQYKSLYFACGGVLRSRLARPIFGRRSKPRKKNLQSLPKLASHADVLSGRRRSGWRSPNNARVVGYTETGNHAWKASGNQAIVKSVCSGSSRLDRQPLYGNWARAPPEPF